MKRRIVQIAVDRDPNFNRLYLFAIDAEGDVWRCEYDPRHSVPQVGGWKQLPALPETK